jgi:hypothetical protein
VRSVQTTALCLTLALGVLVAALSLCPSWSAAVGLDVWNVPATLDTMGREAQLDERLDGEMESVQRRSATKYRVAGDAAEGRLTLLEAAARFRDLDAGASEGYRRGWRHTHEGASDEERYCRQVITYAGLVLHDRSDAAAALGRLQAQLDGALSRGDLRLPD